MKKPLGIVLAIVLLLSMIPVSALADAEPVLKIQAKNAMFLDAVSPMFAVKSENANTVKLLIWRSEQQEYLVGSQSVVLSSQGKQDVFGDFCDVFTYSGFGAKEIADNLYARAYTEKNGVAYYSEVVRYSLLDYAYYWLGKTGPGTTDAKLTALLEAMLAYGAAAQNYKSYHTDRLATDTYYQIKVVDGTLANGFPDDLFKPGTSVTITAPATDAEGNAFNHWENKAGVSVGTSAAMDITVGNANEVYTAKYSAEVSGKPVASSGLEIEDGVVLSIGTCTDDFVILPEEYEGEAVTEIDASAFAGEEFTSIYIPLTVTSIGRRAFNNAAVTDVYYEGTEEQWAEITIGANNAALTGATIHYSSYGPEPVAGHTVTFKDYNGTVLSEQTVNDGEDAVLSANPTRAGYTFAKWTGNYKNVTSDREITAVYYEGTGNAFIVGDAYTTAGGTQIAVPVYFRIADGINELKITVNFGDHLKLVEAVPSDTFSSTIVPIKEGEQGEEGDLHCPIYKKIALPWRANSNFVGNETFVTLFFENIGITGEYADITITYNEWDISSSEVVVPITAVINGRVYVE